MPTWPADEEPHREESHDDPDQESPPADQAVISEPAAGAWGNRRWRLPSLPRFGRLRERWIPESLREARVDPGRSGSLVLSALALVAALVAAIGVWLARPTPQVLPAVTVSAAVAQDASVAAAVSSQSSATSTPPATVVVSVTGAVRQPGLVTLPAGARVADAIAAAGGIEAGVDLTGLNLAARLADGDSVVVGGDRQGVQGPPGSAGTVAVAGAAAPLVKLNTADSVALQSLPGVGPVMASNIIAWRDANGPFTAIDQLQEVTGIGPTRFATLAPLVTLQ